MYLLYSIDHAPHPPTGDGYKEQIPYLLEAVALIPISYSRVETWTTVEHRAWFWVVAGTLSFDDFLAQQSLVFSLLFAG
jgi:hypothetical protein